MEWVQSIKQTMEEEPSLEEQVDSWKENVINPSHIKNIILSENNEYPVINIDKHVYNDLEFFDTNDGNETSVSHSLSKNTITPYGKYVIDDLLRSPLKDEKHIKERQWVIDYFKKNKKFSEKIQKALSSIQFPEQVFWLWKDTDEQSQTLYDMIYFRLPVVGNFINSSEEILAGTSFYKIFVSPFFSMATPILCFILPYIALRYMGVKVSFVQVFRLLKSSVFSVGFISNKTTNLAILSTVVWFAMYFYNLYTIFSVSRLTNNITNIIHEKLRIASQVASVAKLIKSEMENFPREIKKLLCFPECNSLTESLLDKKTILSECSVFNNKGCILATFWKIKEILNDLAKRIRFLGYVDSFHSIHIYLESLSKFKLPWTFAKFGTAKRKLMVFWHPSILSNGKTPVPNSLKVKKKTNTLIVTGPNAAGKSTYVKTIFLNSILAQTLGIAFAKKWETPKPYLYIDTYFNVPDIEGKASTFQAEMKRCFKFVKTLEKLKEKNNCNALVALDEIFTSTNYKEGISGAYAIIKHISEEFPEILCLVTTHYHCLAELEEKTKGTVLNYCLDVNRDETGKITGNSFRVKKGVSREHVALDLLEEEGFSKKIIETARQTYNNISIPDVRFFDDC